MSEAQGKLLQGEMNMTLNMTIMTSARDAVGKCLASAASMTTCSF